MTQTRRWTAFHDMHSGGSQKEDHGLIIIQAPIKEAELIFQKRFGHNPHRVTCTCCGEDYWVSEYKTLKEILDEGHWSDSGVNTIKTKDITPEEWEYAKTGKLKRQGYVWMGDDDDD